MLISARYKTIGIWGLRHLAQIRQTGADLLEEFGIDFTALSVVSHQPFEKVASPDDLSAMRLFEFDFNLPKNLIAHKPASPRDACRLMVLNREKQIIKHDRFYNLGKYLRPGDVLVLNNSKVLPARLMGRKATTGGKVEVLLLKQISSNKWQCLIGFVPIHQQVGLKIIFGKKLSGQITKRTRDTAMIKFNLSGAELMEQIFKIGQAPTPPYIKIKNQKSKIKNWYQTVYAKHLGSAAAPTAGMHFTKRLLSKLKKQGIQIEYVTLHVGLGTFQPVKIEDITKHKMHSEYFELSRDVAKRLNKVKREGRRIVACGTTTVRVLEYCAHNGKLRAKSGETNIFIYPGFKFKFIDVLITNFHVPKSTLIMLVSAFAGKKFIDRAYKIAIKKHYRFYSFGDAMLIC